MNNLSIYITGLMAGMWAVDSAPAVCPTTSILTPHPPPTTSESAKVSLSSILACNKSGERSVKTPRVRKDERRALARAKAENKNSFIKI